MPTRRQDYGKNMTVWLESEDVKHRVYRVIQKKYKGQMTFSSYAKFALFNQLERDDDNSAVEKEDDKKKNGENTAGRS